MEKNNQQERGRTRRGFAAMNPEKQKEIATKGGRTAHQQGVAHKWNSEEAREAGKKGGLSRRSYNSGENKPLL